MRKLLLFISSLAIILVLAACNSTSDSSEKDKNEPPKQIDLEGDWVQINSNSEDSWQEAVIKGDTIEINWNNNDGDTKSLYWAGTFIKPTEGTESYSWISDNDTSKTDSALLASSAETKEFTYEDGILSYEAAALGTTTVIKLEKKSE
ncbi:hypothetical protein [Gracilibacillus sp. Marseille-QA3620]